MAGVTCAAVVLTGCGGTSEPFVDELPVALAEPVTAEDLGVDLRRPEPQVTPPDPVRGNPPDTDSEPDAPPVGDVQPSAEDDRPASAGPSSADAAAFVRAATADLGAADHVVVDVDGDEVMEVVLTGVLEQRAVVRIAWWDAEAGFEVLADAGAGAGLVVEDLRVADINRDGRTEVLVEVAGEGRRSLAVFAVPQRGQLRGLEAVGGCHDGSHVFGVTGARLQGGGDTPPVIVATCDDSPLPVKDWSEQRWEWREGAYHVVAVPSPRAPSPTPSTSSGEDDPADDDDDDDDDDDAEDADERDDDDVDDEDDDEDDD